MSSRPQPLTGLDNQYYWDGVRAGSVLIQRCTACKALRHPPSPMCPECQSLDWDTVAATGKAWLHSYTICHHPLPPWETGPYAVVLVDLAVADSATTPRIVCGTRGIAHEDLKIGMTMGLVFEEGLVFASGDMGSSASGDMGSSASGDIGTSASGDTDSTAGPEEAS